MTDTRIDDETLSLLTDAMARHAAEAYPFERRRAALDSPEGWSREAWADYATLGWLALPLPQAHGGFDGDPVAVGALMRHVGAALALEPVMASAVTSGRLLALAGGEDAALARIAAGEAVWALAHVEDAQDGVDGPVAARFDGERASGRKVVVLHGDVADRWLVTARDERAGGFTLLEVAADAPGARVVRYRLVDGRGAATIELDGAPARPVGTRGAAAAPLARVLDETRLALAAEAHGAIVALNAQTLAYLKQRRQFGRPIGDNQALQHRMVELHLLQQELRAVVSAGQRALRADADDVVPAAAATRAVAAAAAHAAHAARVVAHEGVQLHGGIGMTHELSVSHYFKRLMVVARLLGDRETHLARFAAASAHAGTATDAGSGATRAATTAT